MAASDTGRDERQPFPAEITAKSYSGGRWRYSWKEKIDTPGGYQDADPARAGDATANTLYEANNGEMPVGTIVVAWLRSGQDAGGKCYECSNAGYVTVQEQDGTPACGGIGTVQFHQADGFIVSQPADGVALVRIAAASASQAGIVTAGTQTLAGDKTFTGSITFGGGLSVSASSSFSIASGQVLTVGGPGAFSITAPFRQPPFAFSIANGANNNLNLGTSSGPMIRLAGPTAAWSITGIGTPTPADGDIRWFINSTAYTGTIKNEDAGSTASFRIVNPGGTDATIPPGGAFSLVYDGTSSRWRLASAPASASGFVSPLTTKGDLHTFDTADQRLAVGSTGQYLTANSGTGTGLEWKTLPTFAKLVTFPAAFNDPGVPGDIAYDFSGNFYVCYSSNRWAKFVPDSTSF